MSDHEHPVDPERVAAAAQRVPSAEEAIEVAELFRLLGDPVRTRIMYALTGAGRDVCGRPGAGNRHLRVIRVVRAAVAAHCGVVRNRREGRLIYYRLVDGFMAELLGRQAVQCGPSGGWLKTPDPRGGPVMMVDVSTMT